MDDDNEMKRRRHTPEQIVRKLREADRMIGQGASIAEVLQHLEVTEATYYRWRSQGGFNWSSQHLVLEVFDGEKAASGGSCSVCETAVAGSVGFPAVGEAGVLAAGRVWVPVS